MTKYKLAICEKYNKILHGDLDIDENNYFTTYLIELDEFYDDEYKTIMSLIEQGYINLNMNDKIKNIKFELIEPYYKNDVMLCKLKTNIIRKLQSKWKKKYNKKQNFLKKCKSISYLKYREIHGKFPKNNLI